MESPDNQSLMDCVDSLEKIASVFHDIGSVIAVTFPGLAVVIDEYATDIQAQSTILTEYQK
ncbi:MAG: hypothetical protein WAX33_04935 [Rectinemataceae bacterium]